MKRMFILLGIIITAFALFACEETQSYSIDQVVDSLDIEYVEGESAQQIESDLTLPIKSDLVNIVQIVWVSSNPNVIANDGTVMQSTESNTEVTLTLHVYMGSESRIKDFDLTVLRKLIYHTVTFDIGDPEDTFTVDVIKGDQVDRPSDPTKEGYEFIDWFQLEDLDTPFSFDTPVIINMTLVAVFEEIEVIGEYTVKIYYQNINDDLYTLEETENYQDVVGETITISLAIEGFAINEELSQESGIVSIDDDLVLELYYDREIYTLTFINDSIEQSSEELRYKTLIEAIDDPVKVDHQFIGWTLVDGGTTLFNFGVPIIENTTVYAKWLVIDEYTYEGYYEGADGLTENALTSFLFNLVNTNFVRKSYGESRYILNISDVHPDNSSNILTVYDREEVSGTWDGGVTWNREHVWPNSRLGIPRVSNSSRNIGSDLHNLRPSMLAINGEKSNYVVGNNGYSVPGSYNEIFYPGDADKGDIARIIFYMYVAYEETDLVDYSLPVSSPDNYMPAGAKYGILSDILQWHLEDPVDAFERNRNDVIYSYQNNRNPFIDHPEFVEKIWGPITLSSGETITLDFTKIARAITIDLYIVELNITKKENYIV